MASILEVYNAKCNDYNLRRLCQKLVTFSNQRHIKYKNRDFASCKIKKVGKTFFLNFLVSPQMISFGLFLTAIIFLNLMVHSFLQPKLLLEPGCFSGAYVTPMAIVFHSKIKCTLGISLCFL